MFQKANHETAIHDIQALKRFEISSNRKITITNFIAVNGTAIITLHPKETFDKKNLEEKWEAKDRIGSVRARTTEDDSILRISRKSMMDETTLKVTMEANEIIASPLATQR